MESKISMNEFIDPELGRMVAADSDDEYTGCGWAAPNPQQSTPNQESTP